MGGAVSAGEDNDDLIDNLLEAGYIKTPSVERVFRAVDRAHYFTEEFQDNAYKDLAWRWGNLHLSAPCIYSEVMESLAIKAGLSFLNLGSGTGYLSTMVGLILGPYGINHGIELHEDAVNYALKKLEEFKNTSPALDEYEFCEPKFIQGNCLKLRSDIRQYDRVYCGAACPDYHEHYMKNLVKIGGILVMPLNDELTQFTRIDETTWTSKTVLPVSFAPLVLPESHSPTVALPENEPLSLLELCRSTIRSLLRRNVEMEHPSVTAKRQRQPKKDKGKYFRRLFIPIFEESDHEDFDGTFADVSDESDVLRDLHRRREHFTAVIELARNINRAGPGLPVGSTSEEGRDSSSNESGEEASAHSSDEAVEVPDFRKLEEDEIDLEDTDNDVNTNRNEHKVTEEPDRKNKAGEISASEQMTDNGVAARDPRIAVCGQKKKIPKRKKSDSGLGDEIENGKCVSSDSDHEEQTFMEVDSDSDFSDALPSVKRIYTVRNSSQTPNPGEDSGNPSQESDSSRGPRRRGAPQRDTVIWQRLAFATDEELEETETNDGAAATEESSDTPTAPADTYSVHMFVKIQQLPLPRTLKIFLNLNREF